MQRLFEALGGIIVRRGRLLLLLSALAVVPAMQMAGQIQMETGLETFVRTDTRTYAEYKTYVDNFAGDEMLMVMLSGDVTSVDTLRAEQRFADGLKNSPRINDVQSLASVTTEMMRQSTGLAYVPSNQGDVDAIVAALPPALAGALLPDKHFSFMLVDIVDDLGSLELQALVEHVDQVLIEARFPPGVDATTTGEAKFSLEMEREMGNSLMFMLLSAVIAMVIVLSVVFRHVRTRLLPLVGVIVGTMWTFGMTALLDVPLTMASMAVFPLLIGIGIDYFIQFHNRIDEEVRIGRSPRDAVRSTLRQIGPAVGLAVVCGGLGFSVLFSSPVPMMVDFGGLSLLGIVLCFIAALVFMTPLLFWTYKRKGPVHGVSRHKLVEDRQARELPIERFLGRVAQFCIQHSAAVLLVVVLLTVLGYAYDQKVGISMDEESYVPQDMPMVIQSKKLASIIGSSGSVKVLVRSEDVSSPDVVAWMEEFTEYVVQRHEGVTAGTSLADAVRGANRGILPDTAAEMRIVLGGMGDEALSHYVNGTSLGVISLTTAEVGPFEAQALIESLDEDISWMPPPPGTTADLTGAAVLNLSVLEAITTGRYKMTFQGLLFIFLALLVVYRDWFKALMPVVPVVLVTGLAGGVMYALGMEYTSVSATLGALIIGLGVEYFLLVMTRYYEEKDKGAEPAEAMRIACSRVGVALISSGATTMGGFGALMLSDFPVLQTFGTVTVLIFSLLLVLTFTVLPALLVPLDIWRNRAHNRAPRSVSIESAIPGGIQS
ncbi:MAG: RND family transporter [Dehalococcoidia bacterium]|nr:RND family transporter [Dehalococcoidia bacterium]